VQGIVAASLNTAEVKARFAKQGAEVVGSTPADFTVFIRQEIVKWTKVIKEAGARLD
jgi:tripartite-type tricarboxylate transporter receptor subunit TctC